MKNTMEYKIKSVMIGHAVGDALGVPVEFLSREDIAKDPVTDSVATAPILFLRDPGRTIPACPLPHLTALQAARFSGRRSWTTSCAG